MATEKILYAVQHKDGSRWKNSYWARGAKPVSKSAAEKAIIRAQNRFPAAEYRLKAFKDGIPCRSSK